MKTVNQKGIAPVIILIGVVLVSAVVGGGLYYLKKEEPVDMPVVNSDLETDLESADSSGSVPENIFPIEDMEDSEPDPTGVKDVNEHPPLPPEPVVEEPVVEKKPVVEEPTVEEPQGTKAYGKIKFMNFSCDDKEFKKGTKLVTESGLKYELTENVKPKCVPGSYVQAPDDWDDAEKLLKITSFPSSTTTTVKAVESGRKYEIGEGVFMKVDGEDISDYAAFSDSAFVGGSSGGM